MLQQDMNSRITQLCCILGSLNRGPFSGTNVCYLTGGSKCLKLFTILYLIWNIITINGVCYYYISLIKFLLLYRI